MVSRLGGETHLWRAAWPRASCARALYESNAGRKKPAQSGATLCQQQSSAAKKGFNTSWAN